ncbi:MAG: PorV/PorQ family protein [Elusimicrobia bacterium]|nr:PorV/PorQ family protein [Elusimicrobiota bacterium]
MSNRNFYMMRVLWAAVFLFVAAPAAALFSGGDRGSRGPAILKMGAGVRAAGLGDAYSGIADDPSSLVWNPAGLNRMPRQEILFTHSDSYLNQTHDFLGYALPVWWAGERRTLGLSLTTLATPAFDVVEEEQSLGRAHPLESVVGFSFATPWRELSVGATAKIIQQRTFQESASTFALDGGVLGRWFRGRATWGVSVANIGTPLRIGDRTVKLAGVVRAGMGYTVFSRKTRPRQDALLLAAELEAPFDDRLSPHGGLEYSLRVKEGVRVALRGGFRAGAETLTFSDGALVLGAGVEMGSFKLNYAFIPHGSLGDSNRFDIGVAFGGEQPEEIRQRELLAEARAQVAEGKLVKARETIDELLVLSPGLHAARELDREVKGRFSESIDPETLFNLGFFAYSKGDYERAVDFFRKLLVIEPDHAEAKAWLAKSEEIATADRVKRVKEQVDRVRQRERGDNLRQAREKMVRGEWLTALEQWRRVQVLGGDSPSVKASIAQCREGLYAQGLAAQGHGDTEAALTLFRAVQEGGAPYKDSDRRISSMEAELKKERLSQASELYIQGLAAYKGGDLVRARDLFQSSLDAVADDKTTRRALERVEEELKNIGKKPLGN